MSFEQGEIILYQSDDGQNIVDVRLKDETIWLSQAQMQKLFGRERSVITKHISNVFKEGELDKNRVCAKFAHTAADGKKYKVDHYNLDVIISVGYRVKSQQGTRFRIWATSILKDHLVQGYTLNQKRLAEKGLGEVRQILNLLANTLEGHNLVSDEGREVLSIVSAYAITWQLLWQYDEDSLAIPKNDEKLSKVLELSPTRQAISSLKQELLTKGEATGIFGQERGDGMAGILGAIQQTFGGQDLYPGVEEKAANLLYFIIKDHPFVDGNKRIGSFLFLLFLGLNREVLNFDDKALVALTLLIASSDPAQKDLLIRLVINLLADDKGR
ncbi:MAG: virulence protein RhuM/Fic/DOC family protein [Desulfocapsa sp.]|nr:virulence protein RhuM/Fic/DOC family protein [Desulfocapsa sp.]